MFSTWVTAFWAAILGYVAQTPSVAVEAWNLIPGELKDSAPPWLRITILSIIVFGTFIGARLVKQPSITASSQ